MCKGSFPWKAKAIKVKALSGLIDLIVPFVESCVCVGIRRDKEPCNRIMEET